MKTYIRSRSPASPSPLTHLEVDGRTCRLAVLHAEQEHYGEQHIHRSTDVHAHNVYHLVLYWQGSGEFVLEDRRCPAQRGTLVLTSPGRRHCFTPLAKAAMASYEITLALEPEPVTPVDWPVERVLGACFALDLPPRAFPLVVADDQVSRLMTRFEELAEVLNGGGRLYWSRVNLQLSQLLADVVDAVWLEDSQPQHDPDASLRAAREHIDAHYHEDLPLADLATLACLSPSQFSRRFRAAYGAAPGAYRQALRMNAAKTLLRGRTWTLSEIASRLGYRDIFAFSRMFKRHVGVSPRAFRRANDSI